MSSPTPERRNIDAAREVVLRFRALTGIGDDPKPVAAWTDTLAELIAALHHLADQEIGEYGFDICLDRAAFNYAYARRPVEGDGAR
ncbi:MAG: hypothetical protein IH609_07670 [Dehalococcoidia bacterium]|nr:hypothetical protein [Dehalococcoidia bacterium]